MAEYQKPIIRLRSLTELLSNPPEPREYLMPPLIWRGMVAYIFAKPGIGKTTFSLWLSVAASTGSKFLCWEASEPRNVLYVDSEMGETDFYDLVLKVAKFGGCGDRSGDRFFFLTPESFPSGSLPNIATVEGQTIYDQIILQKNIEILILDNYGGLALGGNRDTDETTWVKVQTWLTSLRKRKIATLLIHHAGKSGSQLGTSRKDQMMSYILNFQHAQNYKPEDGAKFDIKIEKGRWPSAMRPKEMVVWLKEFNEEVHWEYRFASDDRKEHIESLLSEGLTANDIHDKTGIDIFEILSVKKTLDGGDGNES